MPKRLFVAIDPSPEIRQKLADLARSLPGGKPHPPEKLHLTLSFLGEAVPDAVEARLRDELNKVKLPPFSVFVRGMRSFYGTEVAVAAGLEAEEMQLAALHQKVEAAARKAGCQVSRKNFIPHITLGYCSKDVAETELQKFLKQNEDFDAGAMDVRGFTLYSSANDKYSPELKVDWPG